jgi:predicted nucleic acid-binding protein
MKYVADTSTFLAVALQEPERSWLIKVTEDQDLLAPSVLPYEIMLKRKAIRPDVIEAIWRAATSVPVELAEVDIYAALLVAARFNIYAYGAYFLQCAVEARCPLLTLDVPMKIVARQLNLALVEPQ